MNVLLNNSVSCLGYIKNIFQNISTQDKKIVAIAVILLGCVSAICIRYCFKAQTKPYPLTPIHSMNPALYQIFCQHHYDPAKLPVLDMTPFNGSTDYIQYIEPKNMTSPVMQFKDAWGRTGIALHIQGKNESAREWAIGNLKKTPVSEIDGVWTMHQRHANSPAIWKSGEYSVISAIINKRHDETDHIGGVFERCPHCPIQETSLMSPALFENLLTGKDPDFQLGNKPGFNLFSSN